jgi:hypothetical protein
LSWYDQNQEASRRNRELEERRILQELQIPKKTIIGDPTPPSPSEPSVSNPVVGGIDAMVEPSTLEDTFTGDGDGTEHNLTDKSFEELTLDINSTVGTSMTLELYGSNTTGAVDLLRTYTVTGTIKKSYQMRFNFDYVQLVASNWVGGGSVITKMRVSV